MSLIWEHVTRQNPCPICQKTDWCCFGDRAMKCMRVESSHPCASGGWYHFYDNKVKPDFIPKAKSAPAQIDAAGLMKRIYKDTSISIIKEQAQLLGVTPDSLELIGAGWYKEKNALAFPMRDGAGDIVGIRLRNRLGFKWAVSGSRNGLFIPQELDSALVTFLPEGPTDVCAFLSIGIQAIGRPSVMSGNQWLAEYLRVVGICRVVIVADNDKIKQLGNKEGRPGIEGAIRLKKDLKMVSVDWMPPSPIKDVREFVNRGGKANQIQSDIASKIWTKE